MTNKQTKEKNARKSLRLWPGVVIVLLQWLTRLGLPVIAPDIGSFAVVSGPIGALAVVVWWVFFSRAPWSERVGAVLVMVAALAATVGGPLPVEQASDDDEPIRVVQPQLQSVTPLDPVTSAEIQAGQIGTMTIEFNSCNSANLSFELTNESISGSIDILRAVPGTEALCEELTNVK